MTEAEVIQKLAGLNNRIESIRVRMAKESRLLEATRVTCLRAEREKHDLRSILRDMMK